ncbi:hypothetical protein DFH09DRAFT_1068674 [Mycena vulgaris]|nr:hypothetical protein DFH09DRAFT_1068674 [Mycena vulgaris]
MSRSPLCEEEYKGVFECFALTLFGQIWPLRKNALVFDDDTIVSLCQNSFLGSTGSTAEKSLAKVIIFLDDCKIASHGTALTGRISTSQPRSWQQRLQRPIVLIVSSLSSTPDPDSIVAWQRLTARVNFWILRFRVGKISGKAYFIRCSNWALDDSDRMSKTHRFTKIPSPVRESILVKLFKGEPIDEEDDDTHVLAGSCMPRICQEILYAVAAQLEKHKCNAKLSIFIPIDAEDLRAVIIPAAGVPHRHPSFTRTKIPSVVKNQYQQCIDAAGPVGMTTLRGKTTGGVRKNHPPQCPDDIASFGPCFIATSMEGAQWT